LAGEQVGVHRFGWLVGWGNGRLRDVVYHVYILGSANGVLYTGITHHLERRVLKHKQELRAGFTKEYGVARLIYLEAFGDVREAICREKQIKKWRRDRKLVLIRRLNPEFRDLSEDFLR
jgi:putative endonuclease